MYMRGGCLFAAEPAGQAYGMSTPATSTPSTALTFETAMRALVGAAGERRTGSVTAVERTGRRGEMTPLHVHGEDEVVYVLEGSLTLFVNDESVHLAAGDAFMAPRGIPHTHRADADEVRYLSATVARSAARYEDFLRAVAVPADASAESWDGSDDAARLAALAAPNRIEILAAPGAVPA
jgi:quercetin dioxygenase-like cupin family protein